MAILLKKVLIIITTVCLAGVILFGAYYIIERKVLYPLKYTDYIDKYSNIYGVENSLIYSICNIESKFNKDAISSKNAKGIMQLTDATAKYIGNLLKVEDYNIFDAETNIMFGTYYIKYLFERFNNLKCVICAYNAGESRVNSWLKIKEYSVDGTTLIKIPIEETKSYYDKVNKGYIKYNEYVKNKK